MGFPSSLDSKASACNAGDPSSIPESGGSPEEGRASHSCILAWKIPWTEALGLLQSMALQRVGHDWVTNIHTMTNDRLPEWFSGKESTCQCRKRGFPPWVGKIPWRKKWQPTGGFLPGKSHGQRNLAGCSLWGYKRDGQDLATKQPWLMMLYIFSCAIDHLYFFLGEISKSFAHFLLGLLFFLLCIA